MNKSVLPVLIAVVIGSATPLQTAEKITYPAPRFPSYVKPPKSIEDVMPFARAAVRQTGGRTPLGLVEKGTVLIVAEATAEEMVMQAIRRAYEERGVKLQIVPEYELVGINKEEARKAKEAARDYTSEQGYMKPNAGSAAGFQILRCRRSGSGKEGRTFIKLSLKNKARFLLSSRPPLTSLAARVFQTH